jgi:hypothetical protein
MAINSPNTNQFPIVYFNEIIQPTPKVEIKNDMEIDLVSCQLFSCTIANNRVTLIKNYTDYLLQGRIAEANQDDTDLFVFDNLMIGPIEIAESDLFVLQYNLFEGKEIVMRLHSTPFQLRSPSNKNDSSLK